MCYVSMVDGGASAATRKKNQPVDSPSTTYVSHVVNLARLRPCQNSDLFGEWSRFDGIRKLPDKKSILGSIRKMTDIYNKWALEKAVNNMRKLLGYFKSIIIKVFIII